MSCETLFEERSFLANWPLNEVVAESYFPYTNVVPAILTRPGSIITKRRSLTNSFACTSPVRISPVLIPEARLTRPLNPRLLLGPKSRLLGFRLPARSARLT